MLSAAHQQRRGRASHPGRLARDSDHSLKRNAQHCTAGALLHCSYPIEQLRHTSRQVYLAPRAVCEVSGWCVARTYCIAFPAPRNLAARHIRWAHRSTRDPLRNRADARARVVGRRVPGGTALCGTLRRFAAPGPSSLVYSLVSHPVLSCKHRIWHEGRREKTSPAGAYPPNATALWLSQLP